MIATGVKSLLTGTGFDWVRWCKPALLALAWHCIAISHNHGWSSIGNCCSEYDMVYGIDI